MAQKKAAALLVFNNAAAQTHKHRHTHARRSERRGMIVSEHAVCAAYRSPKASLMLKPTHTHTHIHVHGHTHVHLRPHIHTHTHTHRYTLAYFNTRNTLVAPPCSRPPKPSIPSEYGLPNMGLGYGHQGITIYTVTAYEVDERGGT